MIDSRGTRETPGSIPGFDGVWALGLPLMLLSGRATELAVVDAAIDAVAAGSPRVVTVFGEAGIGKSALLEAVRERADGASLGGVLVRAARDEQDVPFGVIVEAFDEAVRLVHPRRQGKVEADFAGLLPGGVGASMAEELRPAERFRLHRALAKLLEQIADHQPLALLLDDVQWADSGSVEVLLHLLRRALRAPVLLVIAMRAVGPGDRLLDAVAPGVGHDHLVLGPLRADAARAVIADDTSDESARERVVAEARGHPLYLRELARAARRGETKLPPTIGAAVELELGRLNDAARAMADGAAVAGDPFDPELAAVASGLTSPADLVALDELVAVDLVRAASGGPGACGERWTVVCVSSSVGALGGV